tara:strand:+ start:1551 stop:1925 length:375 start_codon:yes stop_codon:yes gene_type:complete
VQSADKQSSYNRIDNLKGKGWKPGESGNPNGRPPKGEAWADVANELLNSKEIDITMKMADGKVKRLSLESDKSFRHAVIVGMIKEAMNGNVQAARELADRTEGKSKEIREVTNKSEPIKIMSFD